MRRLAEGNILLSVLTSCHHQLLFPHQVGVTDPGPHRFYDDLDDDLDFEEKSFLTRLCDQDTSGGGWTVGLVGFSLHSQTINLIGNNSNGFSAILDSLFLR